MKYSYDESIADFFDIMYEKEILQLVTIEEIRDAFHSNQLLSKKKAVEAYDSIHSPLNNILVIGSWFGILSNHLLKNYEVLELVEVDKDPRCKIISSRLNCFLKSFRNHLNEDISKFDSELFRKYNTFINTSCEHMDYKIWWDKVPRRSHVLLQSNNFNIKEHTHKDTDIQSMKDKYQLTKIFYEDTLELNLYNRFTLAGIK